MVDLFRKREGDFAKSNKCGGCDQADSVKHCVECVVDICINCAQAHSRFRPTKSHRLLTIEEYETAKTDNPASVQPPVYCKNHRDNQLELFCDTCGVAICHDCTTLDHPRPEHKCRYLTDAAVAFRGALPKMIADGQSKEEKVVPRKAAATATLDSLDSCYLKAEKSLKEHTQSTIENATRVIQENGDTLLRELKELYDGKRRKLDSQIKELEIVQSGLQHAREFSEHLMRYGNASQLMASRRGIVTQFQKLLKIETEAKPADTGFLHFARHDNVFTIRALGMFRTVIAADDFTLEGPNTARVNGWVNWTLTHFLKLSNQILVEQVKSVLKRPDNSQEDMVSMNNGDGTWSFKTYTDVISNYEIAVSVSGKPVQGSPVTVKVIPQKGYIEELCSESIKNSGLMVTNGGNIRVFVTSGGQVRLTEFKPKHPSQYVHGTGVKVSNVSIACASSTKPEHPSLYVFSNNVNIGHNFGENPHTMFSALLTNVKPRS